MIGQPPFARAWLRQREAGAAAVAEVERRELRALGDAEALAMADALLTAAPIERMVEGRRHTSGFVEQQRWFATGR